MTSKFWFLTRQSFNKKVRTKWFLLANILLAIVLVGIINIDSIITFFGGNFKSDTEIILVDETATLEELFKSTIQSVEESMELDGKFIVEISNEKEERLKNKLKENDKVGIILVEDEKLDLKAKIISNKKIDNLSYQAIVQTLNSVKVNYSMSKTNITPEELQKITSSVEIERFILDEGAKTEDEAMTLIMGTVFPTLILPFFMLVIFLVQMIGTEINEEKSTRSMEIIISSVSPKAHFFSKVLASNAFVLLQGFLLVIYSALGLLIKGIAGSKSASSITDGISSIVNSMKDMGVIDRLPEILISTLILMVLSFIAYSLISGILASMTVNMEDFQQIQTPIMMVCLLGYYLSIMAGMFDGSIFIRVLSYIPFLSCLLAPALLVVGQIGLIDIGIAVFLLVLFIYIMTKYGLKIYKVGILNYSTDKMWKRLWNAAKKGE